MTTNNIAAGMKVRITAGKSAFTGYVGRVTRVCPNEMLPVYVTFTNKGVGDGNPIPFAFYELALHTDNEDQR